MRGLECLASVVVLLSTVVSGAAEREWTDSTGKYRVEAEFVDFKDGKVRLKKENGKIISVPIEKLSTADQQFVRAQGKQKRGSRNEDPFAATAVQPQSSHPHEEKKAVFFESSASGLKKGIVQRTEVIPPEDVEAWRDAISESLGWGIGVPDLLRKLVTFDELFRGDEFDKLASDKLRTRLKALPQTSVDTWRDAVSDAIGYGTDPRDMALFLARSNDLFTGIRFRDDVSARLAARLKAIPDSAVSLWRDTWSETAGRGVSPVDTALFLTKHDDLFLGGDFHIDAFEKLIARLKAVPKSHVEGWQEELNRASGERLTELETVSYLIQVDSLFDDGRFLDNQSARYQTRMRSLTPEIVRECKEVLKKEERNSQMALGVVLVDTFFSGDVFQLEAFRSSN